MLVISANTFAARPQKAMQLVGLTGRSLAVCYPGNQLRVICPAGQASHQGPEVAVTEVDSAGHQISHRPAALGEYDYDLAGSTAS